MFKRLWTLSLTVALICIVFSRLRCFLLLSSLGAWSSPSFSFFISLIRILFSFFLESSSYCIFLTFSASSLTFLVVGRSGLGCTLSRLRAELKEGFCKVPDLILPRLILESRMLLSNFSSFWMLSFTLLWFASYSKGVTLPSFCFTAATLSPFLRD